MASESEVWRYGFAFEDRLTRPLALLGIRPDTAHLLITAERLKARFGPWLVRTPLENVAGAEVTGPYNVLKVAGPHLSLADRGVSFGTNTKKGVCIRFHHPVKGLDPLGLLRHPGLTLTVAEPEEAARRIQALLAERGATGAG
ncbi:hypothetical protein [Actinomadura hibisca]|uniref:hypothetical protein n=1 Tax=Actinomadura hibisca TaxID=68565 RepID=UPI000B0721C5|nr:hypothetical protein [Actinomadura hibisca]